MESKERTSNDDSASNARKMLCQLRDILKSDLPKFYEHQRDPLANQLAAFPARSEEAFMAHWQSIVANQEVFKQAVVVAQTVVGNVVCWQHDGRYLVGYWLAREYWGRGIATAAVFQFLEHVAIRPLYARVAEHNVASIRVLEKCGFVRLNEEQSQDHAKSEAVAELLFQLAK